MQAIRVETAEFTSTAAKLPLTLRGTPQSVTVMTRERLEDQNLQSFDDVLNSAPGVELAVLTAFVNPGLAGAGDAS